MRLLQLHEYRLLLQRDVRGVFPGPAEVRCKEAARAFWDQTGLKPWSDRSRSVAYSAETADGKWRLVHVTADHKDCFVIVFFDVAADAPVAYLVFDIGAEYRESTFECPATGYLGPPTEEIIRASIPRLDEGNDPFAILDKGEGTYLQVLQEGPAYTLEHQLVTTECHYRVARGLSESEVVNAFRSYAFGKYEWARMFPWTKMRLT